MALAQLGRSVLSLIRSSPVAQTSAASYATKIAVKPNAAVSFPPLTAGSISVPVLNFWTGEKVAEKELQSEVFGQSLRKDILHRVVVWQRAKRRQGSHKAKNRSEVGYSGSKLRPQKGSGRARCGSRRAPNFVGGGAVFGPVVRSHEEKLQRKVRQLGMKICLSAKLAGGELTVVDKLESPTCSTKEVAQAVSAIVPAKNCMMIGGEQLDVNFDFATRNLHYVDLYASQGANVYDILRRHHLVLTVDAVDNLTERLTRVL